MYFVKNGFKVDLISCSEIFILRIKYIKFWKNGYEKKSEPSTEEFLFGKHTV